jgi:hypothetical protein
VPQQVAAFGRFAREYIPARCVLQADVHVHPAARVLCIGFGHEASDEPVAQRDAANEALEQDGIVDGTHRVVPMQQRDLVLPGRVLGHQRAQGQPLGACCAIDVVE